MPTTPHTMVISVLHGMITSVQATMRATVIKERDMVERYDLIYSYSDEVLWSFLLILEHQAKMEKRYSIYSIPNTNEWSVADLCFFEKVSSPLSVSFGWRFSVRVITSSYSLYGL